MFYVFKKHRLRTDVFFMGGFYMYLIIKRGLDIVLSLMGLLVLWPVFIVITIGIKLDSPGSVLFKQKRVGKNKKYFYILKFRTMDQNAPKDVPTHLMGKNEYRITKFGGFLRRTSLDEIPQIINILKGDMSIVGPRPALWNQYDLIEERDKGKSNKIRPGLTGLAQINGRDELPIDVKASFDNFYADHLTFGMDVSCFFKTFGRVFTQKGVVEGGCNKRK